MPLIKIALKVSWSCYLQFCSQWFLFLSLSLCLPRFFPRTFHNIFIFFNEQRGIYFEIAYSDLIADVQLRRQMIPNAKVITELSISFLSVFSAGVPVDFSLYEELIGEAFDHIG